MCVRACVRVCVVSWACITPCIFTQYDEQQRHNLVITVTMTQSHNRGNGKDTVNGIYLTGFVVA